MLRELRESLWYLQMGRNLEGKKLRRHVLRDTVIVFVTAGYSGKKCANLFLHAHLSHAICRCTVALLLCI